MRKFLLLTLAGMLVGGYFLKGPEEAESASVSRLAAPAVQDAYRLVHAIGNDEKVVAEGLNKSDCDAQKSERKKIVSALGVGGSVTCLPESLFSN
ncbi:hypothetical protein G6N74_29455 [Mesorhizobium sp. CGMCC 1.15528]|uniref:Uncharacterized protein n=1 Tax=Mesorhizobium zhangyense TaxID=1776730 RepID=A0A7C9VC59_9HYPH|nr:hypothetical protein [Mesorhizobium zhangyense]NGN45183.1 hypothetical protein [Mesorhizobium zhangyense]